MECDVYGVIFGVFDYLVQYVLLDCYGNWIGVIGIDEWISLKY